MCIANVADGHHNVYHKFMYANNNAVTTNIYYRFILGDQFSPIDTAHFQMLI